MGAIVVITTVGTEEQANLVAEELVRRRHAACVNVMPIHRSIYRWKGRICRDSEYFLAVKTMSEEYEQVEAAIRELHNYELPEILAFEVTAGSPAFFDWIADCLDKDAEWDDEEDEDDED